MPSMNKNNLNAIAYANFICALHDGGGTIKELSEDCGLTYTTVARIIKVLRNKGAIHIVSWEKDVLGRRNIRSYALGPGKNAKRPQPATNAEKRARYYAKQRQISANLGINVRDARLRGTKLNHFGVLVAADHGDEAKKKQKVQAQGL